MGSIATKIQVPIEQGLWVSILWGLTIMAWDKSSLFEVSGTANDFAGVSIHGSFQQPGALCRPRIVGFCLEGLHNLDIHEPKDFIF